MCCWLQCDLELKCELAIGTCYGLKCWPLIIFITLSERTVLLLNSRWSALTNDKVIELGFGLFPFSWSTCMHWQWDDVWLDMWWRWDFNFAHYLVLFWTSTALCTCNPEAFTTSASKKWELNECTCIYLNMWNRNTALSCGRRPNIKGGDTWLFRSREKLACAQKIANAPQENAPFDESMTMKMLPKCKFKEHPECSDSRGWNKDVFDVVMQMNARLTFWTRQTLFLASVNWVQHSNSIPPPSSCLQDRWYHLVGVKCTWQTHIDRQTDRQNGRLTSAQQNKHAHTHIPSHKRAVEW